MIKVGQVACNTVWVLIAALSDQGLHCLLRSDQILSVNTVFFYAESLWLLIIHMPDDRISSF